MMQGYRWCKGSTATKLSEILSKSRVWNCYTMIMAPVIWGPERTPWKNTGCFSTTDMQTHLLPQKWPSRHKRWVQPSLKKIIFVKFNTTSYRVWAPEASKRCPKYSTYFKSGWICWVDWNWSRAHILHGWLFLWVS